MAKYIFDVWAEIHGTATIDADSADEAWDKLCEQKYDMELTDEYVNGGNKDAHGNYRQFKGRNERDQKTRSKTFAGVASAMADQWSKEE